VLVETLNPAQSNPMGWLLMTTIVIGIQMMLHTESFTLVDEIDKPQHVGG